MSYQESIDYLYSLRLFGVKLGLENTCKLAALVGNPHERLRFIHIAGTNGKGSVGAMLESIYRTAGLRVGLYTSPHLVSFRERIQVNRRMIGEADVVRLVAMLRELSGSGFRISGSNASPPDRQDACPTFFEFVTVLALAYFAEQNCDLVIWETGMGGRLDSTNIVTPIASVITNVVHDHQRWLGHDLRSIATEKAGIIKPGVPVVTATSEPEALAVIQEVAQERECPLTLVTPEHMAHPPLDTVRLPLQGWHQRLNAAVALATVNTLQPQLTADVETVRRGLESVRWLGRLQWIERELSGAAGGGRRQRLLLDGAHNAAGATALRAVLAEEQGTTPLTLILGILDDKDWDLMCEILAPVARRIICVPVASERSADPEQLVIACRRTNPDVEAAAGTSLAAALESAAAEPVVVIAGSLYLVGEAMKLLPASRRD